MLQQDLKNLDALKKDFPLKGKTILVRGDINVPYEPLDGASPSLSLEKEIHNHARIRALRPTLVELCQQEAKVLLLSHRGRPQGSYKKACSLKSLAPALQKATGCTVHFSANCIGQEVASAKKVCQNGEICLLENTRFHAGEEKNDPAFAEALAEHADIFINDAFSATHRLHASVDGVSQKLPAYAGRYLEKELHALAYYFHQAPKPVMALVGGAKINSKMPLLEHFIETAAIVVVGGGMANSFLAALGYPMGKSFYEETCLDLAAHLMKQAERKQCKILLPEDVVVASRLRANVPYRIVKSHEIPANAMALDIGPESCRTIKKHLDTVATVIWNGPMGAFEVPPFDTGTTTLAREIVTATQKGQLVSLAGGGDTVSALTKASLMEQFSYVSLAGGALLEWLQYGDLPSLSVLRKDQDSLLADMTH